MGRGDKVDVGSALFLQAEKCLRKLRYGDLPAESARTDVVVLTEDASKRTVGKKNGTGAAFAADAGFFPEMKGGTRELRQYAGTAKTASFEAVYMTGSRTERTVPI